MCELPGEPVKGSQKESGLSGGSCPQRQLNIPGSRADETRVELRKHPRAAMKAEVWLGQDGIFTCTPETPSDLSEGGAFVETSQHFAPGSILSLRLKLPRTVQPISCTVTVRNLRGQTGMGVQFLDLCPESRQSVNSFIYESASN